MPANPVREKRDLLYIFGLPNPTELLVRVSISGEVQVTAQGPQPLDKVNVLLQPSDNFSNQRTYNLLEFAPIEWWRSSASLLRAVENGWLYVDVADVQPVQSAALPNQDCCDLAILKPPNALIGDLLVYDGNSWTTLNPGATVGNVLTSNGVLTLPSYQPIPDTGQNHVAMALDQSTDANNFEMVGGFGLDASDHTEVRFVTLGAVTGALLTGQIVLHNLTDNVAVVTHVFTTTNPTIIVSAPLPLPSGTKIYEVRIRVLGGSPPGDRVFCTWAGLRLVG